MTPRAATAQRFTAPVVIPCDPPDAVLRDAVVDVSADGRVGYVGTDPAPLPPGAVVHQLTGILTPGLINAHAHTPMTLLRGRGGDLPLMRWLSEVIWPAEGRLSGGEVAAGTTLGCLEMLQAGVTTSVEMYFYSESIVDAVLGVGARAVVTPGVIAVPDWEKRLGPWQRMLADINSWIDTDGLVFGPGGRIELGYAPHSAYTLPTDALADIGAAAAQRGALLHTHIAETTAEEADLCAEHGSVAALLEKLGVLRARTLLAHAVHVSPDDIDRFARCGAGVAHCPGSNSKLASGIAPVTAMRRAGVPVALGTDGPASNDTLNLWDEMTLAARLARLSEGDASALSSMDVLLMATADAAAALGRDDLGVLRPGAWADLVHIDVDAPAFAAGLDVPDAQLLSNLVWGGGARRVRDVWVAGEAVLTGGMPVRIDPAAARAELRAAAARL